MNVESTNLFGYGGLCSVPAVPGQPALDVANLTFSYPGASSPALDGVSLRVMPGEKVALAGPNGAGKSTLIKLLAGLERGSAGAISIFGNPVGACHHRVAYVPQRGEVDWRFPVTVREAVMMGRYVHLGWLRRPTRADHEAVDRALAMMDVTDLAETQIGALSGGQQQRVMIARSLAHDAGLFLLDEPLNSLDMPTQELIFEVMDGLAGQGRAVIVSTHDLGILPLHFTRAVFLDGHIVADGPPNEVLTARTLLRAYGVHLHEHAGVWENGE